MKLMPALGLVLFVGLVVNYLAGYGTRWQLGRYAMPKTLLAADGKTHPDGSECDDVTLALVRRDIEEESYLVALGILLVLFTVAAFQMRRWYRMQMEIM